MASKQTEIKNEKRYVDLTFRITLILKAINAALEIIIGIITIYVTQLFVVSFAAHLTQGELTEDPKDVIANYLLKAAHQFSIANRLSIGLYLISHGVIKTVLVYSLWKKKLWAYPVSLVIFTLFIVYELYRYANTHSLWILALSIFDLLVLLLIWREYRYIKLRV